MASQATGFLYPRPSFYFSVRIGGCDADSSFQEVSGLKSEWTIDEEVREGGQNRFVHKLPLRTKYGNIVLKRGVVGPTSSLSKWLSACFRADMVRPPLDRRDLVVLLLGEDGKPVLKWSIVGAYPVSWDHSALNSAESNLLVETIELSCDFFERSRP